LWAALISFCDRVAIRGAASARLRAQSPGRSAPGVTPAAAAAAADEAALAALTAAYPSAKPSSPITESTVWSGATIGTSDSTAEVPVFIESISSAVNPARTTQPTELQKVKG